jgi:hypothetical protein
MKRFEKATFPTLAVQGVNRLPPAVHGSRSGHVLRNPTPAGATFGPIVLIDLSSGAVEV